MKTSVDLGSVPQVTDETASTLWDELTEVGSYPSLALAHEHALVILAMRQPCWVADAETHGTFALYAEPESAAVIAQELAAYDLEQESLPLKPIAVQEIFRFSSGVGVYALWTISLIVIFLWQQNNPAITDQAASSSQALIGGGQWWRPFTALFVHADTSHLVGNLFSGLLFGTWVSRALGPLRGWLLILLSGTLGNALTSIIVWPDSFVSIGASTAVFGALGILSGLGLSNTIRTQVRMPWLRIAAPLLAGIILLGLMGGGTPGGNTDVLGHSLGFASGFVLGVISGSFQRNYADDL